MFELPPGSYLAAAAAAARSAFRAAERFFLGQRRGRCLRFPEARLFSLRPSPWQAQQPCRGGRPLHGTHSLLAALRACLAAGPNCTSLQWGAAQRSATLCGPEPLAANASQQLQQQQQQQQQQGGACQRLPGGAVLWAFKRPLPLPPPRPAGTSAGAGSQNKPPRQCPQGQLPTGPQAECDVCDGGLCG